MYPVVSFGELLWDLFPDGERLGGCAANVALHAAELGARAVLVSRVGQDERGRRALLALAECGVDVSLVQVDADCATGVVEVTLADGEPTFSIVEEAAWDRIEIDARIERVLAEARVFVYGTLAQRTVLGGTALERALAACPVDCARLLDLNIRPPFASRDVIERSVAHASAVKLNEAELRLVAGAAADDPVSWLFDHSGVSVVALTRGSGGSLLATRSESREDVTSPVVGGDRVGAGDAFTAVLALGLSEGWPLERIGRAANRYAGWVASQPGATPRPPAWLVEEIGLHR